MVKNICSVLLFIFPFIHCHSQILPKEGSELNYRIVPFSFPVSGGSFTLEIASGRYFSEDSFRKNIVLKKIDTGNKIIAEVPAFGSQYTWRITPNSGSKSGKRPSFYHFSTGIIPEVDTSMTRLRIIQPALEYKDAYVFCDGAKALYDMKGNPVWYLPKIEGRSIYPTDLKISPSGSITFLIDQAFDINYEGHILWKAPNTGEVNGRKLEHSHENYHHEFTKLNNGHYMILGMELVHCQIPTEKINRGIVFDSTAHLYLPFGTIIEYDPAGKVVWNWKSSKYFLESDLVNYRPADGSMFVDIHENSFYFDEQNKIIYLNCKGISRIIKIKYPEGVVLGNYGEIYMPGVPVKGNPLYCGQHSIRRASDGNLLLFNNNACDTGALPMIEKIKEPVLDKGQPEIIWEYQFSRDITAPNGFPKGGNILELPDNSLFVSTADPDSKLFILSLNKKILWSACLEKKNKETNEWIPLSQYRASIIITSKQLDQLIWNSIGINILQDHPNR